MNKADIAETVRRACIETASTAYDAAGQQGLCAEGRWEAAISALQMLDLERVLKAQDAEARRK